MTHKEPNISIIVPIYKVEAYLPRCVDSLLGQTYGDFELILVDDGSPDGCGLICDRYAKMDPRVQVIHKINGGLSDARNAGLNAARGAYIAFVDSDDWVSPDYLEKLLHTAEQAHADICECSIIRTAEYPVSAPSGDASVAVFSAEEAMKQLIQDNIFRQHVWNKLYRRRVLDGIRFPKGKINEDEFWTYQVFGQVKTAVRLHIPLYFYFQRPTSIMGGGYSLKRLDALEAKADRQCYIEQHFPALSSTAKVNLFQSAVYNGQMTLLHLSGTEQTQAKMIINRIANKFPLSKRDLLCVSGNARFWLLASKVSFWGTCRIKNILKKGF